MSIAQSTSFSFVNVHNCSICEVQYVYDFNTAVDLAVDQLRASENTESNGTHSNNADEEQRPAAGDSFSKSAKMDSAIENIPIQVHSLYFTSVK